MPVIPVATRGRAAGALNCALLLSALCVSSAVSAQTPINLSAQIGLMSSFITPGSSVELDAYYLRGTNEPVEDARFVIDVPEGVLFQSLSTTLINEGDVDCDTPAVGMPGDIECAVSPEVIILFLDIGLSVSPAVLPDTVLRPAATASSSNPDPTPENNTDSVDVYVQSADASADLVVEVSATPDPVAPGSEVTHRIRVTNLGPSTSVRTRFVTGQPGYQNPTPFQTPRLPATSTFVADTPEGWTCGFTSPSMALPSPPAGYSCFIEAMPPGSAELTLRGRVLTNIVGPISVSAQVTSATPDPGASNNSFGPVETILGFAAPQLIPSAGWQTLVLLVLLLLVPGAIALWTRR